MNFSKMKLTSAGLSAIQQAVYDGKTITFTRAKMGSGTAPADVEAATGVTTETATLGVSSYSVSSNVATLSFVFDNASIQTGFYFREMGIFAQVDQGAEFLYAYANAGADAGYIKPYNADDHVSILIDVVVAVGNAQTVEAVISGAVGYVTTNDFQAFVDGAFNAHLTDYSNPHRVSASDLGLGNVVNSAPSDYRITFTVPATLEPVQSGSSLSSLMGMLARAILTIRGHLLDSNNPHMLTPTSIGAAAREHSHSVQDITGVLPVSKGGTGFTSLASLKTAVKPSVTYVQVTLSASGWVGSEYSLETVYPKVRYNLDVGLSKTATKSEIAAFQGAILAGSYNSNIITALGDVPSIDIPVIVRVSEV